MCNSFGKRHKVIMGRMVWSLRPTTTSEIIYPLGDVDSFYYICSDSEGKIYYVEGLLYFVGDNIIDFLEGVFHKAIPTKAVLLVTFQESRGEKGWW